MSQIQVDAVIEIHAGKLEEFKQSAARCLALVKGKDTDTQQYDWFLDADQNQCIVRGSFSRIEGGYCQPESPNLFPIAGPGVAAWRHRGTQLHPG